jgi:hypothetical protein
MGQHAIQGFSAVSFVNLIGAGTDILSDASKVRAASYRPRSCSGTIAFQSAECGVDSFSPVKKNVVDASFGLCSLAPLA